MSRCPICDTYLNASDLPEQELEKRLKSWPPEQPIKTLRDEIAIEAMVCLIQDSSRKGCNELLLENMGISSYEIADEMLKARDAKPACQHERTDEMYSSDPPCYRCRKCGEFFRQEHNSCKTHKPSIE